MAGTGFQSGHWDLFKLSGIMGGEHLFHIREKELVVLRAFFHIILSPIYFMAAIAVICIVVFWLFIFWLFDIGSPMTKDEYYGRWP